MKTERKIQLVTDDFVEPEVEELTGREAEIDALLRAVADDCSKEIDFEAIKLRAVEAAKAKRAKRGRIRKAIGYGIIAAASLMIGVVILHTVNGMKGKNAQNYAMDKSNVNGDTAYSPANAETWPDENCLQIGAVSEAGYRELADSVDSLFPENLPDSMKKYVDSNTKKIRAEGHNTKGSTLGYECSVENGSKNNLKTGEAWFEEEGDDLWVYWQVTDSHYIKVHFKGFQKNDAYQMFLSVSDNVKQQSR